MSPLETYLNQVRRRLPSKDRDDIIQELREALQDRLDRKEAEWGRPLTAEEARTVLRSFGHPYLVAARYWHGSGLLNGPFTLYYRSTLLWGFAVTLLVHFGLAATRAVQMHSVSAGIARTFPGLIFASTTVFLVTTIAFLALNAAKPRIRQVS